MSTGPTRAGKGGRLLKLLRAAGFRDDLPPSTEGWLDTNPVFQWLSDNLSSENFVSPEVAAAYAELSLQGGSSEAKHKDALASAMGLSDDDSSSDSEDEALQDPLNPEQLRAAIQSKQQYISTLEAHVQSLNRISTELSSGMQQSQHQEAMLSQLNAAGAAQLRTTRTQHQQQQQALGQQLSQLVGVLQRLVALVRDQPAHWLLPARYLDEYSAAHAELENVFARLTDLLQNALGAGPLVAGDQAAVPATPSYLTLQQHPYTAAAAADAMGPSWGSYTASAAAVSSSSTYLSPLRTPRGSSRGDGGGVGGGPGMLTPRGLSAAGAGGGGGYLTPRGGGSSSSYALLAAAGQLTPRRMAAGASMAAGWGPMLTPRGARAAADAVRHRDQAARNKALQKEMGRQGCAFKLALEGYVRAQGELASVTGKLEALEALLADPASPLASTQFTALQREVQQQEMLRVQLVEEALPEAVQKLVDLHDADILKSDYTKNVAKLAATLQRKQAFHQLLLAAIARHLLLAHIQRRQLQHMEQLRGLLQEWQAQLSSFSAAASAREEAVRGLTKEALAVRYNVPPGEAHLQHMAAVVLQGSRAPSPAAGDAAATAAAAAGGGGGGAGQLTPRGARTLTPRGTTVVAAGWLTPRGAGAASPSLPSTPTHVSVRQLANGIQALATNLTSSRQGVEEALLQQLPHAMEQAAAACHHMHLLPCPWLPASQALAWPQEAASSGRGVLRQPVLTDPSVAEAMAAVEGLAEELARSINALTTQQNQVSLLLKQGGEDMALQRRVMALFFTAPEQLAEQVGRLAAEVKVLAGEEAAVLD